MNTGFRRKVWSKISAIRPLELKNKIQASTKDAVAVANEAMMNKLQVHQRRLWSTHMKEQRLKKAEMQNKISEKKSEVSLKKKLIRAQRLRDSETSKRKHAKEACQGLIKVLVPTNIPSKHGYDPTVPQVHNA